MSRNHWLELHTCPTTITGNVAKMKVLHELHRLVSGDNYVQVLDVDCFGLTLLEFWEPLLGRYPFYLTGVDVEGMEQAQAMVMKRGWQDGISSHQGDGYHLDAQFEPESFDVLVATQVLEHVAHLPRFLEQIVTVLRRGGEAFSTRDSAHWRSRFYPRYFVRFLKNAIRKLLSLVGSERRYDLPWFDHEVNSVCQRVGLQVVAIRYYNLAPLKWLHNHVVRKEYKNAFM